MLRGNERGIAMLSEVLYKLDRCVRPPMSGSGRRNSHLQSGVAQQVRCSQHLAHLFAERVECSTQVVALQSHSGCEISNISSEKIAKQAVTAHARQLPL